jgi:hypothetical protein
MRKLLLLLVLAAGCATASAGESELPGTAGPGFWEIGLSQFTADEPIAISPPAGGAKDDYYYAWPFSFRNRISLRRVHKVLTKRLENTRDRDEKALLERNIQYVEEGIEKTETQYDLFISLHTGTGERYHDLALPMIRNLAERELGREMYTTVELRNAELESGEMVHAVAIFPAIEQEADSFEIRLLGLGERLVPSYYPGYLRQAGGTYEPNLRKALRFFYERLGDDLNRQTDPIRLVDERDEWLWMWSSEVYPLGLESFTVERSQGLKYHYRYFPYEVYNSTPDERTLDVRRVGLAPTVVWHGVEMVAEMTEDVESPDFWQNQAVLALRQQIPGVVPDGPRHVSGVVEPGRVVRGLAVVRWGVRNVDALLEQVAVHLRAVAMVGSPSEKNDPLTQAYLSLAGSDVKETAWERNPLPGDAEVRRVILEQAAKEVEADALKVTDSDRRRYGDAAPFAVLVNYLAEKELRRLSDLDRNAVVFSVAADGIEDRSRFVRLYTEAVLPEDREIDVGVQLTEANQIYIEGEAAAAPDATAPEAAPSPGEPAPGAPGPAGPGPAGPAPEPGEGDTGGIQEQLW